MAHAHCPKARSRKGVIDRRLRRPSNKLAPFSKESGHNHRYHANRVRTSLAVKVGHTCAQPTSPFRFKYVVWFTAREGSRRHGWLNEVLNTIGINLGFDVIAQKSREWLDTKKDYVDLLLRQHKSLVILDNFDLMADPDVIGWLKAIPPTSNVIITARTSHPEHVPDSRTHELRPLKTEDALQLLLRFAEGSNATETQALHRNVEAARQVVEVTSGNPQAMKLAVGIIQGGAVAFDKVVAELREFNHDIDSRVKISVASRSGRHSHRQPLWRIWIGARRL